MKLRMAYTGRLLNVEKAMGMGMRIMLLNSPQFNLHGDGRFVDTRWNRKSGKCDALNFDLISFQDHGLPESALVKYRTDCTAPQVTVSVPERLAKIHHHHRRP